jgi:hypothetical protein
MRWLHGVGLVPVAFWAFNAQAAGNLVMDGSFESTVLPSGTWGYYDASNPLAGWTASTGAGDSIEVRHDVVGHALDGRNFVELDSQFHNSGMSQVLNTVAGQTYSLSFYYSNRADSTGYCDPNQFGGGCVIPVSSNGLGYNLGAGMVSLAALPVNTTSENQWVHYTTTFTATGTTTLSFAALGTSDSFGTSLDMISVTAVPEPSTLALMAAGLGGLWLRRRRGLPA